MHEEPLEFERRPQLSSLDGHLLVQDRELLDATRLVLGPGVGRIDPLPHRLPQIGKPKIY